MNNAFITPISEKYLSINTIKMDDVLDGLEHTAALFEMYSIINTDEYMVKFVEAIKQCGSEIEIAVDMLSSKNLSSISRSSN